MRVYRIPFSTNVERVALALAHKRLDVEWVDVPADDRREVVRVSGQELVPVLQDDARIVTDSEAILRYLEERRPDPPLWPRERARHAEADVFVDWFNRLETGTEPHRSGQRSGEIRPASHRSSGPLRVAARRARLPARGGVRSRRRGRLSLRQVRHGQELRGPGAFPPDSPGLAAHRRQTEGRSVDPARRRASARLSQQRLRSGYGVPSPADNRA
jgi:glutathione S-transferase